MRISAPSTETAPAPLTSMSVMTMRRRAGWVTTASASEVVKPVPVNAKRAWKRACSRDMPVMVSAAVATRVMSRPRVTTTMSETTAAIGDCFAY